MCFLCISFLALWLLSLLSFDFSIIFSFHFGEKMREMNLNGIHLIKQMISLFVFSRRIQKFLNGPYAEPWIHETQFNWLYTAERAMFTQIPFIWTQEFGTHWIQIFKCRSLSFSTVRVRMSAYCVQRTHIRNTRDGTRSEHVEYTLHGG